MDQIILSIKCLKMREVGVFHNLVGFMESHDEERLMYNNLLYGNSTIGYDIKDVETSLQRMGLAYLFLPYLDQK